MVLCGLLVPLLLLSLHIYQMPVLMLKMEVRRAWVGWLGKDCSAEMVELHSTHHIITGVSKARLLAPKKLITQEAGRAGCLARSFGGRNHAIPPWLSSSLPSEEQRLLWCSGIKVKSSRQSCLF